MVAERSVTWQQQTPTVEASSKHPISHPTTGKTAGTIENYTQVAVHSGNLHCLLHLFPHSQDQDYSRSSPNFRYPPLRSCASHVEREQSEVGRPLVHNHNHVVSTEDVADVGGDDPTDAVAAESL